ncbi:MAG: TonB-dependent receptor [Bacteroidetes bacterium]|nr:TonB-dependent receptor [Bacteroidota bacterium]
MIHRWITMSLMVSLLIPVLALGQRADQRVTALAASSLTSQSESAIFYTVREYRDDIAELQRRVDGSFVNQPRKQVLMEIARQGNLGLVINPDIPALNEPVNMEFADITVADALALTLAATPFEAALSRHREIVMVNKPLPTRSAARTTQQQDRTLTGTIVDAVTEEPLIGVTIQVRGTTIGATTNLEGFYSLNLPEGAEVLVVSYVGFRTETITIGGRNVINIRLQPDVLGLEDLIVVGYGVQQRREVTGSIASVPMEQIREIPSASFENAILGRVAGVQVQEPSGVPGAGPEIRIRGVATVTAGTDPLYVIDGFPFTRNPSLQGRNLRLGANFTEPAINPLATINQNDIQSIEILKDASAAAIYGSRGSNGVVLVTTNRGFRDGRPARINYNSYVGVQEVGRRIDLMNAEELIDFVIDARNNNFRQKYPNLTLVNPRTNEGRPNDGNVLIPESFINWDGTDTDWQDEMFSRALTSSHNVSVTGGNRDVGYYISAGVFSQDGIVERTGFDRYSLMSNVEARVNDRLEVGMTFNPSYADHKRLPVNNPYFSQPPGVIYSGIVTSPTVVPRFADGTINQTNNQAHIGNGMTDASNPIAIIEYVDDQIRHIRAFGTAYANYKIFDNLVYRAYFGVDVNDFKRDFYLARDFRFRTQTTGNPYAQANASRSLNWLTEHTVNFNNETGNHRYNILAGFTAQREEVTQNMVFAVNFPDDLVRTLNAGQIAGGFSQAEEWSLLSYLSRINYTYLDRYFTTISIRGDRSSRFGRDNQWGFFPSVSAGWLASEENFFQDIRQINYLRLRASIGQTGNFLIPNYGAIGLLGAENYPLGTAVFGGVAPNTISNRQLSWETTTQSGIGLDLGALEDRITFTFDYYYAVTTDLLLNVNIPSAFGYTTALTNIGEVLNKGFEVALTTRNTTGAFRWSTDFNYSTNHNEVLKLGPEGDPILSAGGAGIRHITKVGHPIGSYYGFVTDGLYLTPEDLANRLPDAFAPNPGLGDFRFKDINGDGVIDSNDRTVIGNYMPDFIFGITNRFAYRGLDASIFFQGVVGGEVLNLTSRHLKNGEGNFNSYAAFNDRWRSPEDPGNGKFPRADRQTGAFGGGNDRPSDFQVEDATYFRIRNITMGYNIPSRVLGNSISSARVYASVNNVITWTKYLGFNPEVNNWSGASMLTQGEDYGAHPMIRTYTLGINVSL